MVYGESELEKILNEFTDRIQQQVAVKKIILYGSYAYGHPHEGSDIDLLVVSKDFKGMSKLERIGLLMDIAHQVKAEVDIEVLGFTPHEYAAISPLSMLSVAKTKGQVIYSA
jgi:predicted nucleotidyltransferase